MRATQWVRERGETALPRRPRIGLRARLHRLIALALSSPGRLAMLGIGLVAAVLLAGVVAAVEADSQDERWNDLRRHSEPMSAAASHLYSSLSIADATAATAFLSGGLAPERLRTGYQQALADASAALVTGAVGAESDDGHAAALVASINHDLLRYVQLIATAEADNRAGNPVGVNYLDTASELIQTEALPAAEQMYHDHADEVRELLRRSSSTPWTALLLTALAPVLLIAFQVLLARRTRRVFNVGLVTATAITGVLLIWSAAAGTVSQEHSRRALDTGAAPQALVTSIRILVHQTRTAETISLLRRDPDESAVDDRLDRIDALLDADTVLPAQQRTRALDLTARWRAGQRSAAQLFTDGDYGAAVARTVGEKSGTTESEFAALDRLLAHRFDLLTERLRDETDRSAEAMTLLAPAAILLAAAAAVAIVAGLWPRLSEYQ